ncbi:hypothetical protein ES332_A03G174600v1 [Gossypium tomentosum]|uniref:Uncharacterized protein n=1 Tax=Gossypium tomentosum TaxID=34277 RepID=A0A5D2RAS2_GOSTO|nr:hypothetical protein ES332_A03G174600v1 [Gossypium tomentosum]
MILPVLPQLQMWLLLCLFILHLLMFSMIDGTDELDMHLLLLLVKFCNCVMFTLARIRCLLFVMRVLWVRATNYCFHPLN